MTVNGQVVPFQNVGAGMGTKAKRDVVHSKRQVGVNQPAMTVNGQVVPFQNVGAGMGT
jgi:hypothetical protein